LGEGYSLFSPALVAAGVAKPEEANHMRTVPINHTLVLALAAAGALLAGS
jgi:hypothetical protein